MLEANGLVLEEMDCKIEGYVDRDSTVGRRVTIEKGAEIINSVIRGPSIIGEHTRIINSYIGPYTSIYHHVIVENSEIEHSMVLEHSIIKDIDTRIQDSLIGRNATVTRSPIKPKALKLMLGDNSQVGIL
jgi:glucose-1-phosphate thymidylyltransferase